MMTGVAGMMQAAEAKGRTSLAVPELEGSFTLTTDGEILANNTDEGPRADPAGKRFTWTINIRTRAATRVLIRLDR